MTSAVTPERKANRLELARGMLRMRSDEDVLARIRAMQPEKRSHLSALVTWVENYEDAEQAMQEKSSRLARGGCVRKSGE